MPEWWLLILGIPTLAVVAWQAWETRKAAEATKESVNLGRETAKQQLRAYIHVHSAALKFVSPGVPEAQVHFKNSGQTPAYNVAGWIHTWIASHPLAIELPPAPEVLLQGIETMAPERVSIFISSLKPRLPGFLTHHLGSPEATLYVYGEVSYSDVFGQRHTTRYQLIYGGPDGARKAPDRGDGQERWILCPDAFGNESD